MRNLGRAVGSIPAAIANYFSWQRQRVQSAPLLICTSFATKGLRETEAPLPDWLLLAQMSDYGKNYTNFNFKGKGPWFRWAAIIIGMGSTGIGIYWYVFGKDVEEAAEDPSIKTIPSDTEYKD